MKMIIVREILQPTCPTSFIYLLLSNSDYRWLHSIAKYTKYESFRNLTIITLMCGLSEKSINWNYPHYPVESDGLVFIKILTKATNVHTSYKIHTRQLLRWHENHTAGLLLIHTKNAAGDIGAISETVNQAVARRRMLQSRTFRTRYSVNPAYGVQTLQFKTIKLAISRLSFPKRPLFSGKQLSR